MRKERKLVVDAWVELYERNADFKEPRNYYKRILEAHTTEEITEDVRIMRAANAL